MNQPPKFLEFPEFLGFSSQYHELAETKLDILGTIPQWLSGSFISNGPSQYEVRDTRLQHWIDGFAMLKKFNFKAGSVTFQNRFLRSKQYTESNKQQHLYVNEFSTYADSTLLGRSLFSLKNLKDNYHYDNCNVNVLHINQHFIAVTETNQMIEFNIENLNTLRYFLFNDTINNQLTTVHPHWDPQRQEMYNVAIELGLKNNYHVYKIDYKADLKQNIANLNSRKIISTYTADSPFYMHSFSLTENYVILFQSPLTLNKLKLMFSLPFNKTLYWQKNIPFYFVIIDRHTGKIQKIATDPFVCLHSANAYEQNNSIIIDLICYQEENPYDHLYLDNLTSQNPKFPRGQLKRYILDLKTKKASCHSLASEIQEFPRIHYATCNSKFYHFLYTCRMKTNDQKFFTGIQKTNVETGLCQFWEQPHYYPGEVVFVPNPFSSQDQSIHSEANGLLMFIAYNANHKSSSLILLDAHTLQQMAEVVLPLHLPFGLHGNFYPEATKT